MKAQTIIAAALADVGYVEKPAGSNRTKYGAWYGMDGQPWCMMAVQYWFDQCGSPIPYKTASCGQLMRWAKREGKWVTRDYLPGDVLLFDFNGDGAPEHVGILERVNADGSFLTVEGNTSVTSDDNGGAVMHRTRSPGVVLGAYRPDYDKEDEEMTPEKLAEMLPDAFAILAKQEAAPWAQEALDWCRERGYIVGDGTGNQQPMKPLLRQEAAQIIRNIMDK